MKKIILLAAVLLGVCGAAQAQNDHVYGTKFTDNWSVTLKGGAVSPFQHYAYWKNTRGIFGAEVRKQLTPVFGLGVEGEWTVNTSSWTDARTPWASWTGKNGNVLDHQLVGAFGTFNLSNLFAGYKGTPRLVEFEAVAGAGWLHLYQHTTADVTDENSWYTKYGLNVNFNLGEEKAWTVSFKPAIFWDMNGDIQKKGGIANVDRKAGYNIGLNKQQSRYNASNAAVELEVGVTYHFKNSNGLRYMSICPYKYTQDDIDALNAQINSLRDQLAKAQADLNAANDRIAQLERDLAACKAQKNKVVTKEVNTKANSLETLVYFKVGKWDITRDQQPNVERVATYMKNHKNATVDIKGYASPEGPKDLNEKLAKNRANSVKDNLVKKYKINASRINAAGAGISNMFSELEWNRVAVCDLTTNE